MDKTIVIMQPEKDLLASLVLIVRRIAPEARLVEVGEAALAEKSLKEMSSIDLLITEAYLEESRGLGFLHHFREKNPQVPVLIATRYDLKDYQDSLSECPQVTAPFEDREEEIATYVSKALGKVEGQVWGGLRIEVKKSEDRGKEFYLATDLHMNRQVDLIVLRQEASPEEVTRFQSHTSYKAKVVHPHVLSILSSGEHEGRYYFTQECWESKSLEDKVGAGEKIDTRAALRLVMTVVDVLLFWQENQLIHPTLQPSDITLDESGMIRVKNKVDPTLESSVSGEKPLETIAEALRQLLPSLEEIPLRLRQLLNQMREPKVDLKAIQSEAEALETELALQLPVEKKMETTCAGKSTQKKYKKEQVLQYSLWGGVAFFLLLFGGFFFYQFFTTSRMTPFEKMISIPAGEFIYQDSQASTGGFWIDEYEVTIGQYYEFLRAIEGKESSLYAHEQQPTPSKDYRPKDWGNIYNSIIQKRPYYGQQLTLDSPVFNIDWYDAQAYAKWKGKRLPTEIEWEKAARGLEGNLFPWGNHFQAQWVNSGFDFIKNEPKSSGKVDGFYGWSPVNALPRDKSPFGVCDMGGNVSEWTATLVPHLQKEGLSFAVIRGGNFLGKQEKDFETTRRILNQIPQKREFWIGFRCVQDTAPE